MYGYCWCIGQKIDGLAKHHFLSAHFNKSYLRAYSDVSNPTGTIRVRPATIPSHWMIGARTRLVDSWTPALEIIRLPAIQLKEASLKLSIIENGSKAPRQSLRRRWRNALHCEPQVIEGTEGTAYFDARFDGLHNFSHAFLFVAPLALLAQNFCKENARFENFAVLVRSTAKPFATEALEAFGFNVIRSDAHLRAPIVKVEEHGHVPSLRLCHNLLPFSLAEVISAGAETPKKIYLARRGNRSIRNERQIDVIIEEFGYKKIFLEDFAVIEQIRLVSLATNIVALHGAALGPLVCRHILDRCELRIVEIFGPGYIVSVYREMTVLLGGSYIAVRGRVSPDIVRDIDQRGNSRAHESTQVDLDPESLKIAIKWSEGSEIEPICQMVF